MNIIETMDDEALFARWFHGPSWAAWRVALAATFALPIGDDGAALYRQCTGRTIAPNTPAREAWFIVGRRGGKSRVAALVAVFLAAFKTYDDVLAPGEVGTLPVIAADRRQARTVMRYIVAFLEGVPMLNTMVTNRTKESIELANRVCIEVHTASFRAVRGYSLIGVVCDEIAFWGTDDAGANPDTEILNGLRPGMATIPGAMLIAISSPYARRGALWDAYRRHHGNDNDAVLVWQADTATMNPSVDAQVIADAYLADEANASAEFGGLFRADLEDFVSREVVEACVIADRDELPPATGVKYHAFTDPSGGSRDSFTLAIAHADRRTGHAVLDCLREVRPPFSPAEVVAEFAEVLSSYGIRAVTGDRYAGEWPRERFREHRINYEPSERTKSDIYRDVLPLLNSGQVELLHHSRLTSQLLGLERRTARGGRDSIDHAPGGHDDVANAAAGVLVLVPRKGLSAASRTQPRTWSDELVRAWNQPLH